MLCNEARAAPPMLIALVAAVVLVSPAPVSPVASPLSSVGAS